MMWRFLPIFLLILSHLSLRDSYAVLPTAGLVKDLNPGTSQGWQVDSYFYTAGNKVFMVRNDQVHGSELWVSDGSSEGTKLVKDIRPGPQSASITELGVSGNRIFFAADDGVHGRELWVSDGTEAGTRMVVDLVKTPGRQGDPVAFHAFKGGVVFVANSDQEATALWRSDGTAAGTQMLMVLTPGEYDSASSYSAMEYPWTEAGDYFYFSEEDPAKERGYELWRTDGTRGGTQMVKDIQPGEESSYPYILGAMGKTLFFVANDGEVGEELWKTQGTAASTMRVKDATPGEAGSNIYNFVASGNKAWFSVNEEPWVTDGTASGTRALPLIGELENQNFYMAKMVVVGNHLCVGYNIHGSGQSNALVVTYDVKSGAGRVIFRGSDVGGSNSLGYLVKLGSQCLFTTASTGTALWVTDGTAAGTRLVSPDFSPEESLAGAGELYAADSQVFFPIWNEESELWRTDGTAAGTRRISQGELPNSSRPESFARVSNQVFFTAEDAEHGRELWVTDGSPGNTHFVKDLRLGPDSAIYGPITELGGIAYFGANTTGTNSASGMKLWRSDGTEVGTYPVGDTTLGYLGSGYGLTSFNGKIFFQGWTAEKGTELWVTDGSVEGTQLFTELANLTAGSNPRALGILDGWFYFVATASGSGSTLYRTNGTLGNVESISSFMVDMNSTGMSNAVVRPPTPGAALHPDQSVLFFLGKLGSGMDFGLYSLVAGGSPVLVKPLSSPYQGHSLQLSGADVIMGVKSANNEMDVFSSNGTAEGTTVVATRVSQFTVQAAGDKIYYFYKPNYWHSRFACVNKDGSDRQDLLEAFPSSFYGHFAVGDVCYVYISDEASEIATLWQSRGTPESTQRCPGAVTSNLAPNYQNTNRDVHLLGNQLLMEGYADEVGIELLTMDIGGRIELAEAPSTGPQRELSTVLDLGLEELGESLVTTLIVRNDGALPLANVTLSFPQGAGAFQISSQDLGTITGGTEVAVSVTFQPQASGLQEGSLLISGTSSGETRTRSLTLRGRGVGAEDAPEVRGPVMSQLVLAGEDVTWEAEPVTVAPVTQMHWKRGQTVVGDASSLTLESITHAQVGSYFFEVTTEKGTTSSLRGRLAVVTPAVAEIYVGEGHTLVLQCQASAPVGTSLRYQWLRRGYALADYGRISGSQTATLKLNGMTEEDVGAYECVVTFTTADGESTLSHGQTFVEMMYLPNLLLPVDPLQFFIGETVHYQVESTGLVLAFSAQGLPPGLTIDKAGLITGQPTTSQAIDPETGDPRASLVKITARNSAGSRQAILPIIIRPLVKAGTYEGIVERQELLDDGKNLGGAIKMTITASGALTGQLRYGGALYRFSKPQLLEADGSSQSATAQMEIPRRGGLPSLFIKIQSSGFSLNVWIQDESAQVATGRIKPVCFSARQPATAYAGLYTLSMEGGSDSLPETPEGCGFLSLKVAKQGTVTWKGKLADGTPITGGGALTAESLDDQLSIFVHHDLYKNTGSLHGELNCPSQLDAGEESLDLYGDLDWMKAPLQNPGSERVYPSGIHLHGLSIMAGRYLPPAKGELVLGVGDYEDNASATIQSRALSGELQQTMTIAKSGKARVIKLDDAAFIKAISFNPGSGTFSGSVSFKDPDPNQEGRSITRTASFQGVMLSLHGMAQGFLLLPLLPEEGEASNRTAIISGRIQVNPN